MGRCWQAGWADPQVAGGTFVERPLRTLAPAAAAMVLAALGVLMLLAALAVPGKQVAQDRADELSAIAAEAGASEGGDIGLYRRVSARVAAGENYYAAATDENRRGNYPTKPFVTIRLPTLSLLFAASGESAMRGVLVALLLANAVLMPLALSCGARLAAPQAIGACLAVLAGGIAVMVPDAAYMHEVWAGALLTLSFALWRLHRWWPALIPAILAISIRETAVPFLLLWGAFAAYRGAWKEALAIVMVIVAFAFGIADHASAVEAAWLPGDRSGQGWAGLLGPAPFLQGVQMLTLLVVTPEWLAGPVTVLALFGFLARGGRMGWFALIYCLGIAAMLALFARLENWYWATLCLPLLFAGLAFAPSGLADLSAGLRGPRASGR